MTSTEKAAWAERQIQQAMLGNLDRIACPYCGNSVVLGVDGFCCQPMTDIATVLLDCTESKTPEVKVKAATAGNTPDLQ